MTQTTHLMETSIPLFYQCLRVPSEWRLGHSPRPIPQVIGLHHLLEKRRLDDRKGFLAVSSLRSGSSSGFDPWEKRGEFFRLKRGDTQELLAFLNSVGLFERATDSEDSELVASAVVRSSTDSRPYTVRYLPEVEESYIWDMRDLLVRTLRNNGGVGTPDFRVRIERVSGQPRVIFTTMTFMDALLLTITIDQVRKAKVRKCARPDCSTVFSYTTGHKRKYCWWHCGHVESVRRQRRKAKKRKAAR